MIARPPLSCIFLPLALLLQPVISDYTNANTSLLHDNSQNCSCYLVNSGADSNTPSYFQYYRFWDFRTLADRPGQYTKAPPRVSDDEQDASQEEVHNADILDSDAWNVDWSIQNWAKNATEEFPTPMVNSPANVYIQQNADANNAFTYLTLRTSRSDDFQSSAEIENRQKNLMHVSMRMSARVVGSEGAVAGFFTYYDDTNESDIEILTSDPKSKIRYTNQPAVDDDGNEVVQASTAPSNLPAWDEWQTHRIDWFEKDSYWYLNEQQVAKNTYSVPRVASMLVVNMWSDGGEWSGNMSVGESAELQIQWIELVFNTSGPVDGPDADNNGNEKRSVDLLGKREDGEGCKTVCKVDGVKNVGTPEVMSMGSVAAMRSSWGMLLVVGLVSMVVGF